MQNFRKKSKGVPLLFLFFSFLIQSQMSLFGKRKLKSEALSNKKEGSSHPLAIATAPFFTGALETLFIWEGEHPHCDEKNLIPSFHGNFQSNHSLSWARHKKKNPNKPKQTTKRTNKHLLGLERRVLSLPGLTAPAFWRNVFRLSQPKHTRPLQSIKRIFA